MEKKEKVEARILKGFRDILPADQILRLKILEKIRRVYNSFGFVPIDTPAIEFREVLEGKYGDEATVQTYHWRDAGAREVSLRYDLTVPLARFATMYLGSGDIQLPFKRQHCALVWRAEKPGPGRFREFLQYDIDILGTKEMVADAEIVQMMVATMRALGIERFVVRINNRKVFAGLKHLLNIDEDQLIRVVRVVDKLDKIQWPGVAKELADGKGAGLTPEKITQVRRYLDSRQDTVAATLDDLRELFAASPEAQSGIEELAQVWQMTIAAGIAQWVTIDPTIARGLDYYTGTVFETVLLDCPEIGSVNSGGRYDNLVGMFSDRQVPGVGSSVGVDRLIAGLQKLYMVATIPYIAPVMILVQDKQYLPQLVSLAQNIRQAGIGVELYLGDEKLKKQFAYASKRGVPLVIVMGEREIGKKTAILKDMRSQEQWEILWSDIIPAISKRPK